VSKKSKSGGGSLQEQLKKAGLVTDKQLKKAQKNIHRQEIRVRHGVEVDESKQAAEKSLAAKQARDKEENRVLQEKAQAKALQAQVRQLIDLNRQREKGDVAYNFTENQKVKKIYISQKNKKQINQGFLAIVKYGDDYQLVPEGVARKIQQRLPKDYQEVVTYLYEKTNEEIDEDDPYKDFPIPDDLDW
tara:strand:- start:35884 stop:36450 length:567 start_codon:yes stop_codon:yes gene_type:complete